MSKEELIKNIKKDVKPKKLFGQNFLINPGVYEKIVEVSEIKKGDKVLEIGAGTGILTRYLIDAGADVVAVEKDRDLIPKLKENAPEAKIIEEDILKVKRPVKEGKYKIVANIPYYLTSRLLKTIFEEWPQPKLVVLMVQHDLAKRITAKPPQMSLLSLSVQYYSEPKIITKVSKGSFWPTPEVDSAILRLVPRKVEKNEKLFDIARKAFAGKRKKLSNTLKKYSDKISEAGIDPNRRPETLSVEEWLSLSKNIAFRS
jgi:16S rRNA (adenine1518-N6/adenine1519-N6)-dimethyltransferase